MAPRLARWFFFGAIAATLTIILIGRASAYEVRTQERVITTKHGRTVDCKVERFEDGSIALNDCNYIQVP